jgi:hypothetical protein
MCLFTCVYVNDNVIQINASESSFQEKIKDGVQQSKAKATRWIQLILLGPQRIL